VIPGRRLERLKQVRDEITSKVFSSWWCHCRESSGGVVPHLRAATAAALRARGRAISKWLGAPRHLMNSEVALAELSRVTPGGQAGQFLSRLLAQLLSDERYDLRIAAVEAVGALGSSAPPKGLAELSRLLRDNHSSVREAAVEAVGALGSSVAPKVLAELPRLLRDEHRLRASVIGPRSIVR